MELPPEILAVDLTEYITTPVQKQHLTHCWAFASASAIEILFNRLNPMKEIKISVQDMINNVTLTLNDTENVASLGKIRNWLLNSNPYTGNGVCTTRDEHDYKGKRLQTPKRVQRHKIRVTDFRIMENPTEQYIVDVLDQNIPVVVTFDANTTFNNLQANAVHLASRYNQDNELGHAAVIIGYGVNALDHRVFKIKNSFGTNWGSEGFGWVTMGRFNSMAYPSFNIRGHH